MCFYNINVSAANKHRTYRERYPLISNIVFLNQIFWLLYLPNSPLLLRKHTPAPCSNGSDLQKERKCCLSVPVIHEPPSYRMLAHAFLSYLACCRRTNPYLTAAEQQARPRTLRDRRTRYSHTGRYVPTLFRKQQTLVNHSPCRQHVTTNISLRS